MRKPIDERSKICLDNSTIRYWSSIEGESWTLPVEQVKVVGEYTNGPFVDDYFLVFVTGLEPLWHEASWYADGRDLFLKDISNLLGSKVETKMTASTDFASRVIWPPELLEKSLFEFNDHKPTGIGKLRQLVSLKVVYSYLSDDVHRFITR